MSWEWTCLFVTILLGVSWKLKDVFLQIWGVRDGIDIGPPSGSLWGLRLTQTFPSSHSHLILLPHCLLSFLCLNNQKISYLYRHISVIGLSDKKGLWKPKFWNLISHLFLVSFDQKWSHYYYYYFLVKITMYFKTYM